MLVAVVAGGSFLLPIKVVAWRNQAVYGVAITSDFASGAFPEAYLTWARVRGVPLRDYVPIDAAQRAVVYEVSPAAAELRSVLEDPANGWKGFGCASVGVCDDYAGGWLPWAIRDAAAAAGHFESESAAQTYFGRVRDEISAACDDGRLDCAPALPDSLAPLLRASIPDVLRSAARQLTELPFAEVFYKPLDPSAVNSIDPAERALLARVIVGVAASDSEATQAASDLRSSGWVGAMLGVLYRTLFVVLALLALAGVVLAIRWRGERTVSGSLIVLTLGLATGLLMRLVLFAVVDTTQFAIEPRYHWATRTFLLALLAVGAVGGLGLMRAHRDSLVADAGQTQGEADQDELQASDDEKHPENRQAHRGHRIEAPEALGSPLPQRGQEYRDTEHGEPDPDHQAPLQGDSFQRRIQPPVRREQPEVGGVRTGDDGQAQRLHPGDDTGRAREHRLNAERDGADPLRSER